MARPAARTPKPVAFVFQLGRNAEVGRRKVPVTYADAPCYVHRESEGARTKHLDAMPETAVAERDAEVIFAAIEGVLERCDLHRELSTDREIDGGKSCAYTTGCHPGVSLDAACDALRRGGFTVVRVVDPRADGAASDATTASAPPVHEAPATRTIEDLARRLDHASLGDVLAVVQGQGELGYHASFADEGLAHALRASAPTALVAGIPALAAELSVEAQGALIALVARAAREAKGQAAERARSLFATLPAARDASVKRLVDGWKLV